MIETGTIIKPVSASWPIGFVFHGEDLDGLTIASVVATVLPSGLTVGLAIVNAAANGFYSWVSGGVAGTDYFITFVWTRSDGMITPDIMRVCVR